MLGWRQQYPSASKGRAPYRPDWVALPADDAVAARVRDLDLVDLRDEVDFLDETEMLSSSRVRDVPPVQLGQVRTTYTVDMLM